MKNRNLLTAVVIILAADFLWQLFNLGLTVYRGYFDALYILRYIPTFLGITGIILFINSQYKSSGLLRFYMGIVVFSYPFNIGTFLYYITREQEFLTSRVTIEPMQYVWLSIGFIFTIACAVGLWLLNKTRVARLTYIYPGGEQMVEFTPASRGKRFLNRLIDGIVYGFVMISFLQNGLFGEGLLDESFITLTLFELPFLILYYLFFESIFQSTPGKALTNTIVVNDSGQRPRFIQTLGRTFGRLIPFDALSFFGNDARGWHDSLPGTYVVEASDINEQYSQEFLLDAEAELSNQHKP